MTFDPDWKDRPVELMVELKNFNSQWKTNHPVWGRHDIGGSSMLPETKVVNMRKDAYDVYIGRAGKGQDGYFGNPHEIGYCKICDKHHNRDEAIDEFKKDFLIWVETSPEYRAEVLQLKGCTLGCFCKPLRCHGDVIKEWLDSTPSS